MNQQALGTKRVCQACQARFYDLNKKPITCPKCQTLFDPGALYKSKKGKTNQKEVVATPLFDSLEEITFEEDVGEPAGNDVLLEDPDDLDEQEDVVGSIDHHDEKNNLS